VWRVCLALLLLTVNQRAWGQAPAFTTPGYNQIQSNGTNLPRRKVLNCSTNVTCTDDPANGRTTITATGGGGGSGTAALPVASCMPITGTVTPLFMSPSTCLDQTQANTLERVAATMTLATFSCKASAVTGGGQTVTMTLQKQTACTGSVTDQALTCAIGAATDICSGSGSIAFTAGDCLSIKVVPSGTLTTALSVQCQLSA
jgi:hypothetical protein